MGIDRSPHALYIRVVAAAVEAAPSWITDDYTVAPVTPDGLLTAKLHYARREDAGPEALPEGVTLLWDQRRSWETTDQWHLSQEHRPVIGRRDVIDALEDAKWQHIEDPGQPPHLAKGTVKWRLSGFDDIWRDTDWRASRLTDWRDSRVSAPFWGVMFTATTHCSVIVAAAAEAVDRSIIEANQRYDVRELA